MTSRRHFDECPCVETFSTQEDDAYTFCKLYRSIIGSDLRTLFLFKNTLGKKESTVCNRIHRKRTPNKLNTKNLPSWLDESSKSRSTQCERTLERDMFFFCVTQIYCNSPLVPRILIQNKKVNYPLANRSGELGLGPRVGS